jgi:hypothetical protein
MEQSTYDYQKDSKKGGLLESASKRVRMIFSVMASPNRKKAASAAASCPQQSRASLHNYKPWQAGAEPCPPNRGAFHHRERQDVCEDKQAYH